MSGSMGGSSTTETKTTPSPFDVQKAQTSQLMRQLLMPNIQAGLTGESMPLQQGAMGNMLQQSRYNAGRFGMAAGTPQLNDMERQANESLTKPNSNMLQTAMGMLGASQPGSSGGSSSSDTTTDPGMLQTATSLGSLAMMAAMAFSSAEYKDHIKKLSEAEHEKNLKRLMETDLFNYNYKGEDTKHTGMITEVAPKQLTTMNGKAIDLYEMASMIGSALKAMGKKVDRLESKV
jgi:hypothetical protein